MNPRAPAAADSLAPPAGPRPPSILLYERDIASGRLEWLGDVDAALGYPPNAFPRTFAAWTAAIHPDDRPGVLAALERHLNHGEPYLQEYRILRRDGSVRSWVDRGSARGDPAAGSRRWIGAVIDATEFDRAQVAVREGEERYRRLVDLSPDAVGIHADGRIVFANRAMAELLGAESPDQILGRAALDFVHPGSRGLARERMERLAAGPSRAPLVEETFVRLDGSLVDVEVAAVSFPSHPRPATQVVVRDISRRKRADQLQAALYRISETSAGARSLEALYPELHRIVGGLLYSRNFYIALKDPDGRVRFPYFVDEEDAEPPEIPPGRKTLTEYVLRTRRPLLAGPEVFRDLVERGEVDRVGGPSIDWLGAPLVRGGEALGVIVVQSYSEAHRLTERDQALLTFVSQHVAAAIERQRAADALRESEARFRTVAETAPCAIFIYQGARLLFGNQTMTEISGYSREELIGQDFWKAIHPDFQSLVRDRGLARQRGEAVPTRYELQILHKDGSVRWVEFNAGAIQYEGQPATLGTAFDITARKEAEEQIRQLAYRDALTGLPNRRLFMDRLSLAVAQAHRQEKGLALLFLDLDHFKVINDTLGHALGDRLLMGVAERLLRSVREGDTVSRLAGDEFTLLLPAVGRPEDAKRVAEKILEGLRAPFALEGHELRVTGSIGLSVYPEHGREAEALLAAADAAMYEAKQRGRDNCRLAPH